MTLLVHARRKYAGRPIAVCEQRNARYLTTDDDVTCTNCLFAMGLFVPLRKLGEHQKFQRMKFEHASGAPYPVGP